MQEILLCQPIWACSSTEWFTITRDGLNFNLMITEPRGETETLLSALNAASASFQDDWVVPQWKYWEHDGVDFFTFDQMFLPVFALVFKIHIHCETASPYPYWIIYNTSPRELRNIRETLGEYQGSLPRWNTKIRQGKRILMFRTEDDRALARLCL